MAGIDDINLGRYLYVLNVIYTSFQDKRGAVMKRVGLVVFPGFQILDLVAISVFEV